MLTKAEIRTYCYTEVYNRGFLYFANGRVQNMTIELDEDIPDELIVCAQVGNKAGRVYETSITLSDNETQLTDSSCTCPYVDQYDGICKHCVALALAFQAFQKNRQRGTYAAPQRAAGKKFSFTTSFELTQALERYAAERSAQLPAVNGQPVHLDCLFASDWNRMSMQMCIGRTHMYVVKNILLLMQNITKRAHVEYGKQLAFTHLPEAFDEPSRAVIDALLRTLPAQYPDFKTRYITPGNQDYRHLELRGEMLDRILNIYIGGVIELDGLPVDFREGDPDICFTLQRCDGGAELRAPELRLFEGAQHNYVLQNEKLYRCTAAFSERVIPLWRLFKSEYGRRDICLKLSEQDFRAFTVNIQPALEGLAKVSCEGFDLADYAPPEPVFTSYIGRLDDERIGVTATVGYGTETLDLLDPKPEGHGWRDPREDDVRACLMRYFPVEAGIVAGSTPYTGMSPAGEADDGETIHTDRRGQHLYIANGDECLWALLNGGLEELSKLSAVYIDEALRRTRVRPAPNFAVGVSVSSGLLDLNINAEEIGLDEVYAILNAYRRHQKFHRLKSGDLMPLDDDGLEKLSQLSQGLMLTEAELKSGHARLPAYRAAYVDSVLEDADSVHYDRSREFRRLIRELKDYRNSEYLLPEGLNAQLRPYQVDGFQWLCALYHLKLGGILADDMGLGKTLEMIALFLHARQEDPAFTALVVAPASLLYNWEREIGRFAPALSARIIAGTAAERAAMIADANARTNVSITSYDLMKRDIEHYASQRFDCLVLDEAQYIKNASTKAARAVFRLDAAHRFAMTGTPVENRLSDLWSIFNALMPGYLYPYETFRRELEQPVVRDEDDEARARLQRMIAPFLLRRRKADVLRDLPDKLEENLYVSMSDEQAKLYRANRDALVAQLSGLSNDDVSRSRVKILAALTRLRQLCCSPELCYENYTGGSGKIDACIELIERAVGAGHRVLVFSQFTSMLELLIKNWKGAHLYLSGKDGKAARRDMVDAFQNGDVPVFFISLKAGGTGLNLTRADMVIHCDPWWNVAAQNQATDRAHRIGQKNVVNVIRLVARDTIEEKIIALQEKKSALAETVCEAASDNGYALNRDELLELFTEREKH